MSHYNWEAVKDDPVGYMIRINEFIRDIIKESKNKRWHEHADYVEIIENDPDNEILKCEVCCTSWLDMMRNKYRHNVFFINIPYEVWFVIEGDMGRALEEYEYDYEN